jgi:hypothetical protein
MTGVTRITKTDMERAVKAARNLAAASVCEPAVLPRNPASMVLEPLTSRTKKGGPKPALS